LQTPRPPGANTYQASNAREVRRQKRSLLELAGLHDFGDLASTSMPANTSAALAGFRRPITRFTLPRAAYCPSPEKKGDSVYRTGRESDELQQASAQ
jgi:hypothetical protein